MGKGVVSKWVGRQGGNFPFGELVEKEPMGPVVGDDLVRGMDPDHLEPMGQLRVPDSNHEQMGK